MKLTLFIATSLFVCFLSSAQKGLADYDPEFDFIINFQESSEIDNCRIEIQNLTWENKFMPMYDIGFDNGKMSKLRTFERSTYRNGFDSVYYFYDSNDRIEKEVWFYTGGSISTKPTVKSETAEYSYDNVGDMLEQKLRVVEGESDWSTTRYSKDNQPKEYYFGSVDNWNHKSWFIEGDTSFQFHTLRKVSVSEGFDDIETIKNYDTIDTSRVDFKFNDSNLLYKKNIESGEDLGTWDYEYEYVYDDAGNWIECTESRIYAVVNRTFDKNQNTYVLDNVTIKSKKPVRKFIRKINYK